MNTSNSNIIKIKRIIKKPVVVTTETASTTETTETSSITSSTKKPRALVACNSCRGQKHHKCDGFPCSHCVKKGIECVKEPYKVSPGSFKKGQKLGENNNMAKLTGADVLSIRTRYMNGLKHGELKKMTEEYNVKYSTIQTITQGRTWTDPKLFPEGWVH